MDDNIVFLLERRHEDQPHPDVIHLGSNLAEPMSLALMGQSGTMLGHGYRVEVRIVVWQGPDVLKLPLSALFRDGEAWAVYAVSGGVARLRHVTIGHSNSLEAEVLEGLAEGERVILHPSDRVRDGVRIVALSEG